MKQIVQRDVALVSFRRQLHRSALGSIYARFEGMARFELETETQDLQAFRLTLDTKTKQVQLQVDDLLFGAHGKVTASKNKLSFTLGLDHVAIEFEPFSLNPVAVHLPSIKLPAAGQRFRVEQELPALGLTGAATLEIELFVEFVPDYRNLAKHFNATTAKKAVQMTKSALYKVTGHTGTVGRLVVRAGRAAVVAPFKLIGNSIGRQLAMDAMKLGSKTKALQNLIVRASKILSAGTVVVDTWLSVKAALPGVIGRYHKNVLGVVNPEFAQGYTLFMTAMTAEGVRPGDTFLDWTTKLTRMASTPPDMLGVVEKLAVSGTVSGPDKHAKDWVTAQMRSGPRTRNVDVIAAETSWEELYREGYNLYYLFMDLAQNASGSGRVASAFRFLPLAQKLVNAAGMIAAYQDVVTFVIASSLFEDARTGSQPTDLWEGWRDVAAFHRSVFGADAAMRQANFLSLVDVTNLRVSIPPFADFQ